MRISFINPIRELGGGERWLMSIATALREQGHEPAIHCRPGTSWEPAARQEGLKTLTVPMLNDISLVSIRHLARSLVSVSPDVVVCCNQRAVRLGVVAARLAGGVPVVFRCGSPGSFKNGAFNRWLTRTAVSRFVVNARSLAKELREYGWVPENKISVIYNGVDSGVYWHRYSEDVRRRWGVPLDSIVVIAVGRLIPEKSHVDLVRAAALLAPEHPDLRVVILGEGSELGRIRAEVSRLKMDDVVHLPGFEHDMPAALAAADLFCHPSRREGLSNAVQEAMATGLPVVATPVDGTPEAVEDGATGFLVQPGDVAAFADRLNLLLTRPGLRNDMGRRARYRVEGAFPLSVCRRQWEELLTEVIEERRRPAQAPVLQPA